MNNPLAGLICDNADAFPKNKDDKTHYYKPNNR